MKRTLQILLGSLFVSLMALPARANENTLFEKATASYNNGDYKQAVSYYEQILKGKQHSASLYFNLGNAYYKMGEVAPSIYYFEKALLLKPGDSEITNNLGYAQNMTLDTFQALPKTDLHQFYERWVYIFNMDTWAYLGVIFMLLFVGAFIFYGATPTPSVKRIAFITSFICLFITLLSTSLAYLQFRDYTSDQPAVIFEDEVIVRSDPNPEGAEIFRIHEGTKVQLQDKFNEWYKVVLIDGQTGWIPIQSFKPLKDF